MKKIIFEAQQINPYGLLCCEEVESRERDSDSWKNKPHKPGVYFSEWGIAEGATPVFVGNDEDMIDYAEELRNHYDYYDIVVVGK